MNHLHVYILCAGITFFGTCLMYKMDGDYLTIRIIFSSLLVSLIPVINLFTATAMGIVLLLGGLKFVIVGASELLGSLVEKFFKIDIDKRIL